MNGMKKQFYFVLAIIAIVLTACSSPAYVRDSSSYERQKELINARSAALVGDIFIATATIVSAVAFETECNFYPTETRFKKIALTNPLTDTLYVNMLTDVQWDKEDYCDFMDIRIPPGKVCRILCPIDAEYNIYFSNTPEADDDEMVTINTSTISKMKLKPGLVFSEKAK
jgi:hypothetical protein